MINGIYSIYFSGVIGEGFGLLIFKDGVITGADAAGAKYEGHYEIGDVITGKIQLFAPPGVQLVTGASAGENGTNWEFPISVPLDFSDGRVLLIETTTGRVNVIFNKIRDLI